MYHMKFIDGTPVDSAYELRIAAAVRMSCVAEELVGIDSLEQYAEAQRSCESSGVDSAA
jgi:hypothetical protein